MKTIVFRGTGLWYIGSIQNLQLPEGFESITLVGNVVDSTTIIFYLYTNLD